jgi:hypothetical protein
MVPWLRCKSFLPLRKCPSSAGYFVLKHPATLVVEVEVLCFVAVCKTSGKDMDCRAECGSSRLCLPAHCLSWQLLLSPKVAIQLMAGIFESGIKGHAFINGPGGGNASHITTL